MGAVPRSKVDPAGDAASVEVVNVKADGGEIQEILSAKRYYPAFHMNKKCWVSIILDNTLPDDAIHGMIDDSNRSIQG